MNCGNTFERAGHDLGGDGGDRELAAGLLDFGAVLLAHLLEHGHVGLVELRDVRNRVPGVAQVFGGLAADAGHRLALDLAPLREVGQRRADAPARAGAAGGGGLAVLPRLFITRLANSLTSSSVMRPPGPVPVTCADVDANLAREPSHRRRGRRRRDVRRRGRAAARRGAAGAAAANVDDRRALRARRSVARGASGACGCLRCLRVPRRAALPLRLLRCLVRFGGSALRACRHPTGT